MNSSRRAHEGNAGLTAAASARPRTVGVIPARLASSRFPEKVLANKTGKPLIDLITNPMHQHQSDSQAFQQGKVMNQIVKVRIVNRSAAEKNYEGAVAVGMDIRR